MINLGSMFSTLLLIGNPYNVNLNMWLECSLSVRWVVGYPLKYRGAMINRGS